MSLVNLTMIKALREVSGAGIKDCKEALISCAGNQEEALDFLRKKGLAATMKAGRSTSAGLAGVIQKDSHIAVIELNSETDFVSRNELFQNLCRKILQFVIDSKETNIQQILESKIGDMLIGEMISELMSKTGENISLGRVKIITGKKLFYYVHNKVADDLGLVVSAVAFDNDNVEIDQVAKEICMHIVANNTVCLKVDDVDPKLKEKEQNFAREKAELAKKSPDIIEKIVQSSMLKVYKNICLYHQPFVMDNKKTVSDILPKDTNIIDFIRFTVGEGVNCDKESC